MLRWVPMPVEPKVLHEDQDVIVVDKPAGTAVHPGAGVRAESPLTEWLVARYPELVGIGESAERPGLVHRLDADTSGVMVVARTAAAYTVLKSAFKTREVKKQYIALVEGRPEWETKLVDLAIKRGGHGLFVARHPNDVAKLPADEQADYRQASTEFRLRQRLDGYTLLDAFPRTGRTHQIRVHLKAVGFPIVGDALYSPAASRKRAQETLGLERQFLHAAKLEFVHPTTGERVAYESPLPTDLQSVLDAITKQA